MAYSFIDLYRPLRFTLRAQGTVMGLGMGALLTLASPTSLARWGIYASTEMWPYFFLPIFAKNLLTYRT